MGDSNTLLNKEDLDILKNRKSHLSNYVQNLFSGLDSKHQRLQAS